MLLRIILVFIKTAYYGFSLLGKSDQARDQVKNSWAKMVLQDFGFTLTVEGVQPPPGSFILVGNHISYLDIPVLMAALPEVTFIAKDDLKKWPIIGACAAAAGTIFVDRKSGRHGRLVKNQIVDVLKTKNKKVAVFPAGTTSLDERFPWKKGIFKSAQQAAIPVQLFHIDYTPLRESAYVDDDQLLKSMFRILRVKDKEKTVRLKWMDQYQLIDNALDFSQRLQRQLTNSTLPLLLLLMIFTSCAGPTQSIQGDIIQFQKNNSGQIQSYRGKSRSMNYAWSGDRTKRALLFVHGSPGDWQGWAHFLNSPELQKKFNVISIDRPGYGLSTPGISVGSLATQASDIIEVLKSNESHLPAIVIGHSYGGPVIAKMAIDFPDQIGGLIFVASSVDPDLEMTKWYQSFAATWPLRLLIPTSLRVCNEEIMALKPELIQLASQWKKISAKSVLIQGAADPLVPPANIDFLLQHLNPEIILQTNRIEGLNHFVPWKRPDLIFQAIEKVDHELQ